MRSRFFRTVGLIGWFSAGLPVFVYGQTDHADGFVATSSLSNSDQLEATADSLVADGEQVIRQPAGPPPTPRHTGIKAMFKDLGQDVKHLPSKENLFWTAIGGGLALAVHPADDNVNESMVNSSF